MISNRLKALEREVESLDESEFKAFANWFSDYQDRMWERKLSVDAEAGRLDFLISEAAAEREAGTLRGL